jgi:ribosomal protein S18 acetylase RimI-like enzyme
VAVDAVQVRSARRGDIPSLALLWAAMMEENARLDPRLAMHPHAKEHMAEQFAAWLQDPSRVVLVAEEQGRLVVGYAAGCHGPGNGWQVPATLGQVTDCYVVPARRRRGVARRLGARLRDLLFERGVSTVRLNVAAKNEASRAFWRSMGWEDLEVILERETGSGPPPERA